MRLMLDQIKLQTQLLQQLISTPTHPSTFDANKKEEKFTVLAEQTTSSEICTIAVTLNEHQKFQLEAFDSGGEDKLIRFYHY